MVTIGRQIFDRLPAFDRLKRSELSMDSFDLSRFQNFLDRIGNPEKGLPVIHVAGSKGKGSTVALTAAGLMALGKRVGVFMSPYLYDPTESIFVDGRAINRAVFDKWMVDHEPLLTSLAPAEQLTSFEVLTSMALQYFHTEDVDFAVMEVGLGGRLDATNVVESPVVSVICPIEKEHTDLLGNSLTSIAYEKLGIVREDTPVLLGEQDPFVLDFARTVCLQKGTRAMVVPSLYQASVLTRSTEGYSFRLHSPSRDVARVSLALLGDHQIGNALNAWAVLDLLLPGFEPSTVLDVWAHLTLPGRFEFRAREGREVVLDAAHTPASARALRRTFDQLYGNEPITFIVSFLEDKDVEGIFKNLLRPGDAVVVTQLEHPRALPARTIEERLRRVFAEEVVMSALTNNVRIAWQKACRLAGRGPICITGSFKLIESV